MWQRKRLNSRAVASLEIFKTYLSMFLYGTIILTRVILYPNLHNINDLCVMVA